MIASRFFNHKIKLLSLLFDFIIFMIDLLIIFARTKACWSLCFQTVQFQLLSHCSFLRAFYYITLNFYLLQLPFILWWLLHSRAFSFFRNLITFSFDQNIFIISFLKITLIKWPFIFRCHIPTNLWFLFIIFFTI